jgi:hypothetical protein
LAAARDGRRQRRRRRWRWQRRDGKQRDRLRR